MLRTFIGSDSIKSLLPSKPNSKPNEKRNDALQYSIVQQSYIIYATDALYGTGASIIRATSSRTLMLSTKFPLPLMASFAALICSTHRLIPYMSFDPSFNSRIVILPDACPNTIALFQIASLVARYSGESQTRFGFPCTIQSLATNKADFALLFGEM